MKFTSLLSGVTGKRKLFGISFGFALFVLILLLPDFSPGRPEVNRMAAVAALMAVWWVTEALPLPATALIPLVLFPSLKLMPAASTASEYINSTIFLFLGGFLIAIAIEKWNLHRRIALSIMRLLGDQPRRLILGFMISTAFLSMWISNTATSLMMLPVAVSVIKSAERSGADDAARNQFAFALMIAIAYSASIGGVATLIGTPPNIVFSRIYSITFPGAPEMTFAKWMVIGLPFSIVFLIVAYFLLTRLIAPIGRETIFGGGDVIGEELRELGCMSREEKQVAVVFGLTAILWITRISIQIGALKIPGWSDILGVSAFVDDATVAVSMALVLFLIPSRSRQGDHLLDWRNASKVPWGILILFGGGFALARGFGVSGLAEYIGESFRALEGTPTVVLILSVSLMLTFLTELTSNTATAQTALPILASISAGIGVNPLLLMLPATISASCAFMLPVATPPNAIVFSSGYIPIARMARAGFILNVAGALVVLAMMYFVAIPILGLR